MLDFEPADLERCLELAAQVKADRALGRQAPTAQRSTAATSRCCSKSRRCARARRSRSPSANSAATSSSLQPDAALGRREPVADVARNLERWVDAVVIRTFSQQVLEEFAARGPAAARHQRAHRRASIPARRSPIS